MVGSVLWKKGNDIEREIRAIKDLADEARKTAPRRSRPEWPGERRARGSAACRLRAAAGPAAASTRRPRHRLKRRFRTRSRTPTWAAATIACCSCAVAAYAVLLSILMISRGISVTPDVVVVAFGLAAIILGRGRLFLRDWIPFVALFFAYELMRGYADKFGLPIHVDGRHLDRADHRARRVADQFRCSSSTPARRRARTTWPRSRSSSTSCISRCRWRSASCCGSTNGASTTTSWPRSSSCRWPLS